ncbi:MAG: FkbM family methyltransferase [Gemmatimonadaceae bacterium]
MRKALKGIMRLGLNTIPRVYAGNFVRRFPRFVPYLDDRDVIISIDNPYYGHARFRVSRKYRVERELLYRGAFDEKSLLYFMRLLRDGDICLDVGANIGALSLSMAHRVGARGKVVAFEPGRVPFERLKQNVELSGAHNVEPHELGLAEKPGEMFWALEEGENSGNGSLSPLDGQMVVKVMRLDACDAIKKLPRIDFIKIDVEGMELEVITGAMGTIERHHPSMLIETLLSGRPEHDTKIETMLAMLSSLGYELWEIDIRERDLRAYHPDFAFIPCKFPSLPQNTLFVHKSRRAWLLDSSRSAH